MFHSPRADFSAQTRPFGDFESAVYRLEIHCAELPVVIVQVEDVMLMDYKVGDDRLQVERSSSGQGTSADMSLYRDVIHIGHVADFLTLSDATAVAQVRLDDLDGLVLKVRGVLPAGVDAFAMSNRHLQSVANESGSLWCRSVGLFKIEYIRPLAKIK